MKLRALQATAINTPNGLRYVEGPEYTDKDEKLADGQIVEVPDDFLVNRDVFEVVVPVDGKPNEFVAMKKDDPRLKAVQFFTPSEKKAGTAANAK